jgi:hypothetical protein
VTKDKISFPIRNNGSQTPLHIFKSEEINKNYQTIIQYPVKISIKNEVEIEFIVRQTKNSSSLDLLE